MKPNKYVNESLVKYESMMETIIRRKMLYYGHTCRHNSIAKTIIQWKDLMTSINIRTNETVDPDIDRWGRNITTASKCHLTKSNSK